MYTSLLNNTFINLTQMSVVPGAPNSRFLNFIKVLVTIELQNPKIYDDLYLCKNVKHKLFGLYDNQAKQKSMKFSTVKVYMK